MKIKKGLYRDAFNSIFENLIPRPKYELDWQYGFPSFKITFETKEVLDLSKSDGLTEEFSERIGEICKKEGRKKIPFDVSKAIWFTYDGEL